LGIYFAGDSFVSSPIEPGTGHDGQQANEIAERPHNHIKAPRTPVSLVRIPHEPSKCGVAAELAWPAEADVVFGVFEMKGLGSRILGSFWLFSAVLKTAKM
jgi:hypothetical protein